jgi:NTE family protein
MRARTWLLLALALALAGCVSDVAPRIEDVPLAGSAPNPERRALDLSDRDRPVIIVTFSGGGTRAALLASSVVRELSRYQYQTATGTHRLSGDIRVVSSVSGGSVTAAYIGLHGTDGLETLENTFLVKDNLSALIDQAFNPAILAKLTFTGYTRIDAWEDLLDQRLFHNVTMAALNQPGHPYVILNATDMSSGEVFDLTPTRFDDICADFDRFKISTGVAASSAFPVLLTPVTLQVYSSPACSPKPPEWIGLELTQTPRRYTDITRYKDARYSNDLRHGSNAFRQIDYVHLLDGGVADNLGIGSIERAIKRPESPVPILQAVNTGQIRRLVVIVVNARSDTANPIDTSAGGADSVIAQLSSVTSVPVDATSAAMADQAAMLIQDFKDAANAAKAANKGNPPFANLQTYGVTVDFDQFLPGQQALETCAKTVPTSWTLTPSQFATIRAAGPTLLRQHPDFQRLITDLGLTPVPADPAPVAGCPG